MTSQRFRIRDQIAMTPHQKIMRAAKRGTGLRLTAKEVAELSFDDAIATLAINDDERNREDVSNPRNREQWEQERQAADRAVRKPLTISAHWIYYAHNPGADSGQPLAIELTELPIRSGRTIIPADREDMVREIISVAELYAGGRCVDQYDRMRSMRAARVIKRCREWLGAKSPGASSEQRLKAERLRIRASKMEPGPERRALYDKADRVCPIPKAMKKT